MVFHNSEDIQIPKTKKFLESVYDSKSAKDTHTLYRDWAKSYEEELISNEYVTPFRCAEALDRQLTDKKCNILDLGCGTGLLGRELQTLGYKNIDGIDFSNEMLKYAKETMIYRKLSREDLNSLYSIKSSPYDAVIAAGIISPSHANPDTINLGISALKSNGIMIFSFNDHALNDKSYMRKIQELKNQIDVEFLEESYGNHIKKLNLNATVYVIQKLD